MMMPPMNSLTANCQPISTTSTMPSSMHEVGRCEHEHHGGDVVGALHEERLGHGRCRVGARRGDHAVARGPHDGPQPVVAQPSPHGVAAHEGLHRSGEAEPEHERPERLPEHEEALRGASARCPPGRWPSPPPGSGAHEPADGGGGLVELLGASSPPWRTASDTQWARWSSSSSERHRLEGLGRRRDLLEDLDAVPVLVHHALEAPDLALHPAQALLDGVLVVDVAGSHVPPFSYTPIGYRRRGAADQPPRIPSPSSRMPLARASAKFVQPEPASPRSPSRPPSAGAWRGRSSPRGSGGGAGSCARRSRAASTAGASRAALARHLGLVPLLEGREHLATEELERLADVLVAVVAGLQHEDHLVDARLLEPLEVLAHLRRSSRCARAGRCGRPPPAWPRAAPGAVPSRSRVSSPDRRVAGGTRSRRRSNPGGARRRRSSARGNSRRSSHPRDRGRVPPARRDGTSSASRTRCSG